MFRAPWHGGLGRGDEDPVARELLEQRRRLAEVGGEHVDRVAGDPHGQVDRLVVARVEADQDAAGLVADVLDRVAVALGDVADVALVERLGPVAAVRAEQRDADLALDDVLPLVGGRVPVQLAEAARLEVEDHAGDRLRDRERGRHRPATRARPCGPSGAPGRAAGTCASRGASASGPCRSGGIALGRHRPAGEVDLVLRGSRRRPTRAGRSSSPAAPWGCGRASR